MNFSETNIELVKKFISIKNRGLYCDSKQLQKVYNEVLNKNLPPTSCGSCLRQRVSELERALREYEAIEAQKKAQEATKQEEPATTKVEEKEAPTEPKKKRGRPKKKKEE